MDLCAPAVGKFWWITMIVWLPMRMAKFLNRCLLRLVCCFNHVLHPFWRNFNPFYESLNVSTFCSKDSLSTSDELFEALVQTQVFSLDPVIIDPMTVYGNSASALVCTMCYSGFVFLKKQNTVLGCI